MENRNINIEGGSISIVRERRDQMHITSKSIFFENEVVVKLTDEAVIFRVAGLDDKKIRKAYLNNGHYHISVNGKCKEGRFYFDPEESNCDMVVIYCR